MAAHLKHFAAHVVGAVHLVKPSRNCHHTNVHHNVSEIEKEPRGIQGEYARKDTASLGKLVSEHKQVPKKGDG